MGNAREIDKSDPDLIRAREIVIGIMEERFREIRAATDFERTVIEEAEDLRDYLIEQETRTFCILVVSFMEDVLRRRFIHSWHIDGRATEDAYFGSNGPLSTFSQRLIVAKGLGWLSDEQFKHASVLRKIRNEFAHNHRVRSFAHEPLLGLAESLRPVEKIWHRGEMPLYRAAYDAAPLEVVLRMRVYCNSMAIVGGALARSKLLAEDLPPDLRDGEGFKALTEIEQAFIDHTIRHCFKSLGIRRSGAED